MSDFSLVNPLTWYKEEFPGVMAFTGGLMKGMGYTGQNLIGKSIKDSINSIDLFFWDRSVLEHDHYFRLVPQTLHIIRLMDSAVSFFPTGITFQSSVW